MEEDRDKIIPFPNEEDRELEQIQTLAKEIISYLEGINKKPSEEDRMAYHIQTVRMGWEDVVKKLANTNKVKWTNEPLEFYCIAKKALTFF